MFIGFIAVVIILLVIVALMASGVFSGTKNSQYLTEAKKVHALLGHLKNESKFYYSKNETFSGISMNYFNNYDFAADLMVYEELDSTKWDGWPVTDDAFPAIYTGPSIKIGGSAGDDMRILVAPINSGKNAGFFLIKKKDSSVSPVFTKIIERTLAGDPAYIGG